MQFATQNQLNRRKIHKNLRRKYDRNHFDYHNHTSNPGAAHTSQGKKSRNWFLQESSRLCAAAMCAMKQKQHDSIPVMDYRQYRRARRLVHECCNYDFGNCIALDNGEECVCVQSISYSLLCKWFRAAVLPLDKELEAALFHRLDRKRCCACNAYFLPGSNRAKYCPKCAATMKRIRAAERKRKQRAKCHALGAEKSL